mgnify:CR=1 FL=1
MSFEKINNSPEKETSHKITSIEGIGLEMVKNREEIEALSIAHNITVENDGSHISTRQINNPVFLPKDEQKTLIKLSSEIESKIFNIPAKNIPKLLDGTINSSEVITDPVSIILLSSLGLLNKSEWTSNQPSEGIWVLAEWLERNEASASPICIDPNLITEGELEKVLSSYKSNTGLTVLGFSLLPVNLKNDIEFIQKVKNIIPESLVLAGGIGSDSLNFLSSTEGKKGVTNILPIDLIIPGNGVLEIEKIIKGVHDGRIINRETLISFYEETLESLHNIEESKFEEVLNEVQKSRETVHQHFIPETRSDLVHNISYQKANEAWTDGKSLNIVPVLIDNSCDQNCYFCASPKSSMFSSIDQAVEHIANKTKNAKVIAFNDNDLSNKPAQTTELCKKMKERGITQQKHGKIRANRYIPELLDSLAEAGFVRIAIGVESFSQYIRSSLGKKDFTEENIQKTLNHLLRVGIRPEINLILFSPKETEETLKETAVKSIEWLNKGAMLYVTLGLFATPNSPGVLTILKNEHVSKKIKYEKVVVPEAKDSLLIPYQWRATEGMTNLEEIILKKRVETINMLSENYQIKTSVPIEAYITISLLAHYFLIDGYQKESGTIDKIITYAKKESGNQYVSI